MWNSFAASDLTVSLRFQHNLIIRLCFGVCRQTWRPSVPYWNPPDRTPSHGAPSFTTGLLQFHGRQHPPSQAGKSLPEAKMCLGMFRMSRMSAVFVQKLQTKHTTQVKGSRFLMMPRTIWHLPVVIFCINYQFLIGVYISCHFWKHEPTIWHEIGGASLCKIPSPNRVSLFF